ncbi:globin [Wenzhouxiangella marina]|uniref:Globin n=1 Tax=Wenzhouxiangella marina TaxID=1579979 RepID=A0A0K0XY14_9GAMM|nr:globin [Wenzhouxiangella marina]AKS42589.1 globin [Wenzhouxiangella marina]MBB6085629.1 hemoglobin-like flavoprotein [Wenzhouxiangella marina]
MSFNTEAIQGSYGRCLRERGFITRFYELLLERDPRIPDMFKATNWSAQNKALRRGISIALTFAGGSNIVQNSMDQMAEVHSRKGRAPVDPVLYKHWRESLLQAVREFDPRINDALMADWDKALRATTDYFTEHY